MAFSFGGVIGFQFLLSYPERAHSAILLEPYLPREEPAAVKANTEAYLRALAMYQAGDKLGAAQRYMEDVCGPHFLSAVEMTGPLDVWQRVEAVRRHRVPGGLPGDLELGVPDVGGGPVRAASRGCRSWRPWAWTARRRCRASGRPSGS